MSVVRKMASYPILPWGHFRGYSGKFRLKKRENDPIWQKYTHMLHVWYVYLHSGDLGYLQLGWMIVVQPVFVGVDLPWSSYRIHWGSQHIDLYLKQGKRWEEYNLPLIFNNDSKCLSFCDIFVRTQLGPILQSFPAISIHTPPKTTTRIWLYTWPFVLFASFFLTTSTPYIHWMGPPPSNSGLNAILVLMIVIQVLGACTPNTIRRNF